MGVLTDIMTGGASKGSGGGSGGSGGSGSDSGGGVIGAFKRLASKGKKRSSGGSSSGNTDDPGAPSYHSGGTVRKTGLARLKKGERVLTKGQQQRLMKGRNGRNGRKSGSRARGKSR